MSKKNEPNERKDFNKNDGKEKETENKNSKKRGKKPRNSRNSNEYNGGHCPNDDVINDASWYIEDPGIRNQVGSFSMNSTIGIDTPIYNECVNDTTQASMKVPSVMGIFLNPSCGATYRDVLGFANSKMSAINMAARDLYSKISSVNAKTTQYQPQDLAFAILAVGELESLISVAVRAYGIAFNYNQRNRDIPRTLLKATGLDPDSLLDDLAGFRMKLNKLLVPANQVVMLKNIKYLTKCWDLYSNYYVDSDSLMAQTYIVSPASYWLLDESTSTGTRLKTTYIHSSHVGDDFTYNAIDLLNAIKKVTDALLTSTTFNYIYTDIRNYVSKLGGETISFGYLPESYSVQAKFNAEFLMQVHNLRAIGMPIGSTLNDVTQSVEDNTVEYKPQFNYSATSKILSATNIMDFPINCNPTPDDKINATMLMTQVKGLKAGENYSIYDVAIPDHYPVRVTILSGETVRFSDINLISSSTQLAHGDAFDYTKFDYAPGLYLYNETGQVTSIIGDLNFFDAVRFDQLKNIFEYAYLGLFKLQM